MFNFELLKTNSFTISISLFTIFINKTKNLQIKLIIDKNVGWDFNNPINFKTYADQFHFKFYRRFLLK